MFTLMAWVVWDAGWVEMFTSKLESQPFSEDVKGKNTFGFFFVTMNLWDTGHFKGKKIYIYIYISYGCTSVTAYRVTDRYEFTLVGILLLFMTADKQ